MGFALELALEDPTDLEPFTCAICQELYRDPVHAGCPDDHVFCSSCLADHVKSTSNLSRTFQCPLCRARVRAEHVRAGLFVKRQLDRLRVRCSAAACDWTGRLGENHEEQCPKRIISCANKTNDGTSCSWRGPIPELPLHHLGCPLQLIDCPRVGCDSTMLRRELSAHDLLCEHFRCTFYLVDECPWRGRRQDLSAHSVYCSRIHKRLDYLEQGCAEERRLRKVAEEHAATFAIQASRESYAEAISSDNAEEDVEARVVDDTHSPNGKLPTHEPAQPTSPPSSTLDSSPQRSSSAPPPPSFQLTAALPYRPLPNPPPAPPAPAPQAHYPAGPFNLTSAAPSVALPRPVGPLPSPTSGVAGPFSLTRRPTFTVSASVPSLKARVARSTGALFDFGLGGRSAAVDRDEEDAEDDPGRWEKGGAKRPRFDGGFPREWAQQEEG